MDGAGGDDCPSGLLQELLTFSHPSVSLYTGKAGGSAPSGSVPCSLASPPAPAVPSTASVIIVIPPATRRVHSPARDRREDSGPVEGHWSQ